MSSGDHAAAFFDHATEALPGLRRFLERAGQGSGQS